MATFFSLLFFVAASSVEASLLVIDKDGTVTWKVLAEESNSIEIPKSSGLSVREVVNTKPSEDAQVILKKDGEKISLVVLGESGNKELDVSGWKDDLVEIEERPEIQTVKIGIDDGKFSLEQKGIVALTDFPINIDAKTAKISVLTESGDRFVSILPYQATEGVLRSRLVTNLSGDKIYLIEQERELAYAIDAVKEINFFNIYKYPFPIKTYVSASTGEIISVDQPAWLRVLGFLFS